ncbi:TPA: hypothetical protein ACSPZY_004112, partial [Aeromonas veronii]
MLNWNPGDGSTQPSPGTCSYEVSDRQPFSRQVNLTVGNDVPNGTVVYQWSYDDFMPFVKLTCTPSGRTSELPYPLLSEKFEFNIPHYGIENGDIYKINGLDSGLGLRLYATVISVRSYRERIVFSSTSVPNNWHVGTEYKLTSPINSISSLVTSAVGQPYNLPSGEVSLYKIRAELVKYGTVKYGAWDGIRNVRLRSYQTNNSATSIVTTESPSILGNNGLNIIAPQCRAIDRGPYVVSLPDWIVDGSSVTYPLTGSSVPVNIA